MKTISFLSKYILTPVCTVAGIFYGVDRYVIERAETVVEPVRVEVRHINEKQDQFYRAMDSRMNSMDEKLNILIERK